MNATSSPALRPIAKRFHDGRDELNLADFPISTLQRQQQDDGQGGKRDTAVFEASRYDPTAHRRVRQRVTLETSSRHGLPTPADENVVLALLYVAKHSHNFAEPVVHFAPRQLFEIMGWAPNSRSYDRLRAVLRRLKALVIRYENSWWDIGGRAYEDEVATGIIVEYELGRQVGGRRKGGTPPPCWVSWTPQFQRSLSQGNLKKLDLDRLFALRLPTSQRMYRFLDKRFYPASAPPPVEMDLHDFAFGHVGLARVENVAELKRRLAPALAELEGIGYIEKVCSEERYRKVRPGVWRIHFRVGPQFPGVAGAVGGTDQAALTPPQDAERSLAAEYYRLWDGTGEARVGSSDLQPARDLLARYEADAPAVVAQLCAVVKRRWPECKSFSGAVRKYLAEAEQLVAATQRREEDRQRQMFQAEEERSEVHRERGRRARLEDAWEDLNDAERFAIEDDVSRRHAGHRDRPAIFKTLCLAELERRVGSQEPEQASVNI
jgi:hypothetical protein